MKTTLDHLPEEKQKELGRIVPIIREMCDDVEMIILFGSYARGDYREDGDLPPDRKSGTLRSICEIQDKVADPAGPSKGESRILRGAAKRNVSRNSAVPHPAMQARPIAAIHMRDFVLSKPLENKLGESSNACQSIHFSHHGFYDDRLWLRIFAKNGNHTHYKRRMDTRIQQFGVYVRPDDNLGQECGYQQYRLCCLSLYSDSDFTDFIQQYNR